jgi:hypothetical protein
MSDHTNVRLETTGGTVIAYLAPNQETTVIDNNDLFEGPRKGGTPSKAIDSQVIQTEISVQGELEHSDNLPDAHATDLETLFGTSPVTALDQVNRIRDYLWEQGGPFYLHADENEYTAESESAVDVANGVYPTVQVDQFRPVRAEGLDRVSYTIKMIVGVGN